MWWEEILNDYQIGVDRFEIINHHLHIDYTQLLGVFCLFFRACNMYPLRKPTVAMSYLVTIYFQIFCIDYLIHICEYFMY